MADPMKPPKAFKEQQLNKSKGILDDFAVRKNVATREGSITRTPVADIDIANKKYVDDEIAASPHTPEGTAVKSTGEGGASKFLREDGDDTCSWQTAGAVPAGSDTEVQFNDSGSFGASSNLIWDGSLKVNGDIKVGTGVTGAHLESSPSATNPTYTFDGDTNTGIGLNSYDRIDFIAGGNKILYVEYDGSTQQRTLAGYQGSPTNPAFAFINDKSTGIYWPVTNKLAFSAGGKQILHLFGGAGSEAFVINDDSRDIDFRVEGLNDAYAIFMEGSSDKVGIGTATPTTKFSVMEKCGMTPIGGFAVRLTNKTGSNTIAGQLVKADTANNDAFILSAGDDLEHFAVVLDSGVSDGSEAWVVIYGIADVAMEDNTTATRGNWVRISVTEAGYADATNASAPQPINQTHFTEVGHCIETVTAGGAGTHILARCILHFN